MASRNLTPIESIASVSVTYDATKYIIVDKTLSLTDKQVAKNKSSDITVERLVTYFKVTDLQHKPVTSFSPPIKFQIEYSPDQWKKAKKNNKDKKYKRPRLAYLAKPNNQWASKWVEFKKKDVVSVTASSNGSNGFLVLSISSIPDPLIGGC